MKQNSEADNKDNNRVGKFLSWVNSDDDYYDEPDDDIDDDDEHEGEYSRDYYDDDLSNIAKSVEDEMVEYGSDDEFDYPDEILPTGEEAVDADEVDIAAASTRSNDDEHSYADATDSFAQIKSLKIPKKQKRQMRYFRIFYIALSAFVAINVITTLLLTVNYLPPFGAYDNPAVNEVYTRYTQDALRETGAPNLVAAVLYAYRSFDTLGEAMVLFTAALAVIMLLLQDKKDSEPE